MRIQDLFQAQATQAQILRNPAGLYIHWRPGAPAPGRPALPGRAPGPGPGYIIEPWQAWSQWLAALRYQLTVREKKPWKPHGYLWGLLEQLRLRQVTPARGNPLEFLQQDLDEGWLRMPPFLPLPGGWQGIGPAEPCLVQDLPATKFIDPFGRQEHFSFRGHDASERPQQPRSPDIQHKPE